MSWGAGQLVAEHPPHPADRRALCLPGQAPHVGIFPPARAPTVDLPRGQHRHRVPGQLPPAEGVASRVDVQLVGHGQVEEPQVWAHDLLREQERGRKRVRVGLPVLSPVGLHDGQQVLRQLVRQLPEVDDQGQSSADLDAPVSRVGAPPWRVRLGVLE